MQPFSCLNRYYSIFEKKGEYKGVIMKKNNKAIINTYKTIYSVDIVVANKYTTLEQLQKLYCYYDNVELDKDILDGVGSCSRCRRKSDKHPIALIKWNADIPYYKVEDKKAYMINTMSHEALHAAIDIYEYMGQNITFDSTEPLAYLVGWITECIYNTVVNNKINKT